MRVKGSQRRRIQDRYQRAFRRTMYQLNDAFQDVITSPRTWAGFEGSKTYRANGSIVIGSFRNIEDLGNLASSQKLTFSENKATFSWDGNGMTNVLAVYFGHRTSKSFVPGRDWIGVALSEVNLAQMFRDNLK